MLLILSENFLIENNNLDTNFSKSFQLIMSIIRRAYHDCDNETLPYRPY